MKNIVVIIIVSVLTIFTITIGIINAVCNPDFFCVSSAQILTLLVTIGVAFWASQFKNDQRKAKEHVEQMLVKLQQMVSSESFYCIPAKGSIQEVQKTLNTNNRKINNYIDVLKKYGDKFKFKSDIDYISSEFETYKQKIGDHISDLEYLSKTEVEFRRVAENIDSKCDYILFSLYK